MAEQKKPVIPRTNFAEIGHTGLRSSINYIDEEFLPELRSYRGAKVYQQMSSNDPTIGAILFAAKQLIRKTPWYVKPGGDKLVDKKAAEFVETCRNDMLMPWNDLIMEILSMLPYGYSYHEKVYKRRLGGKTSKYDDGRIGWAKLPGRSQLTQDGWEIDEHGEILGMYQAIPNGTKVFIPIEKALLFRTEADRNNPEGRSLLRNAYRPWFFKKQIEEVEGIGIERDLAGLPVLTPPEGLDIWNPEDEEMVRLLAMSQKLISNIRRDENEGVVKPFGWTLELLASGSRRQFDTNAILNRYDQRIAITVLADMIMLGADKVGSFALANVKKSLFGTALLSILDNICETFNRNAIPELIDLNVFPGLTDYPYLAHGEVDAPNMEQLGKFISDVSRAGAKLFPDINLENHLRVYAGLPEKTEEVIAEQEAEAERARQQFQENQAQNPKETQENQQGKPQGKEAEAEDGKGTDENDEDSKVPKK